MMEGADYSDCSVSYSFIIALICGLFCIRPMPDSFMRLAGESSKSDLAKFSSPIRWKDSFVIECSQQRGQWLAKDFFAMLITWQSYQKIVKNL